MSKADRSIGRGPNTQRESSKVRGIAGHIEQTERGATRKSPQAHKHFCPLVPTAKVFESYGFVLVQVQVQVLISHASGVVICLEGAQGYPQPPVGGKVLAENCLK